MRNPDTAFPRLAYLWMDGWAGIHSQPVTVLRETPKRYEIECRPDGAPVKLAGRARWLKPGQKVLVPKHAVRNYPRKEER